MVACKHVFYAFQVYLGIHIVVVMAGIPTSQEIFAIGVLTALRPSLKHDSKHILGLLRLCRDQALGDWTCSQLHPMSTACSVP